jgi:hypothetical protein
MTVIKDDVPGIVVAFCAPNPEIPHFTGQAVGFYDCPTVLIDRGDGHAHAWAAHLARPATPNEAIEYWRRRAEAAEARIHGMTPSA